MTPTQFNTWQSVRSEVLRRIQEREWQPGEFIPNEADLALEFGCARATVNRALRAVAEAGLLDRRRKAGTRVAEQPVAKATFEISVIRKDVEARGQLYTYQRIRRSMDQPSTAIRAAMQLEITTPVLHVVGLHLADGRPYALEDRWINLESVPTAKDEPFSAVSANEWLLSNARYTDGDIEFSAKNASQSHVDMLGCEPGAALFSINRLTWDQGRAVTHVELCFSPNYKLQTKL